MRWLLTAACLFLALPVAGVLGSWLAFDAAALAVLQHQAATVLGGYAGQSLLLALGVAFAAVFGRAQSMVFGPPSVATLPEPPSLLPVFVHLALVLMLVLVLVLGSAVDVASAAEPGTKNETRKPAPPKK